MNGIRAVVAAAALGLCGSALAQDEYRTYEERETAVFLRGGVAAYTGSLGSLTQVGPAYGVTINLQPWTMLGLELSYQGSRNSEATAFARGAVWRNGGDAFLKLSPPFLVAVKPFLGAGIGASYLSAGDSTGFRNDTVGEVPLAAGIEFNTRGLTAGVRGTYRVLFNNNITGSGLGINGGDLVDGELTLGGRF